MALMQTGGDELRRSQRRNEELTQIAGIHFFQETKRDAQVGASKTSRARRPDQDARRPAQSECPAK